MTRNIFRVTFLGILLAGFAAFPGAAQVIPPGTDWWVTPPNGQTFFTFPDGDVEALCGAPPTAAGSTAWDHRVYFRGIPQQGQDWDTAVTRLDKAVFDTTISPPTAFTRIQVRGLAFASLNPQATPCGELNWTAGLAGPQSITKMTLQQTTARGGVFFATIAVKVELRATDANTGNYIGSLFYSLELPDPATGGTAWSFGPTGAFRAGMTETDNCIKVLRAKLLTYAPASDHYYYISNMISQGRCTEQ
jgi:hypothetical protein